MSTNANLTNATCPLILRINGEQVEYLATPLSESDYESIDLWIQSQVIAISRFAAQEGLDNGEITVDQYEELLSSAARTAISVSLYESSGAAIVYTPKGAARLAWQMTRKHHPELKYKELLPYFKQVENYTEVFRVLNTLNPKDTKVVATGDSGKNDGEVGGEPTS